MSLMLFLIFPRCPKTPFFCPSQFQSFPCFNLKQKRVLLPCEPSLRSNRKSLALKEKPQVGEGKILEENLCPWQINKLGKCRERGSLLTSLPCMIAEKGFSPQAQLSGPLLGCTVLLWHWEFAVAS